MAARARPKVGVQLHPQDGSVEQLRKAWRAAEDTGADSIWLWDHFFPLYATTSDDSAGPHFEGWTLLSAMAVDTSRAQLGVLVTCNSFRNPDLLADMARTVDHVSGGRVVLGIGAGWFERDYVEYGYEFGTAAERLAALAASLPRIKKRLARLDPAPMGPLPILIGGSGEKVALRLVAEHASAWNSFGPAEKYARLNGVLDDHCAAIGRNPAEIERTVLIQAHEVKRFVDFLEAGADHVIVECPYPYDLVPLRQLVAAATTIGG